MINYECYVPRGTNVLIDINLDWSNPLSLDLNLNYSYIDFMNTSDITFIITTWHSEHLIYKQIDTLPKTSEIIVVENSNNV